jgi:hypothetical protein
MKKTILFGLASAALLAVGCTNDETVEIPASKAITFANAFVDNNTKADPSDPSIKKENLGSFDVFGYVTKDSENSQIFDEEVVSSADNGETWTYTNIQYWIDGGKYVFAAVAPSTTSAKTVLTDETTITTTVSDFENTGESDLVYATATATGQPINNAAVALTFKHLLSKVKFTFVNKFATTSNISLKVTNVTISDAVKTATVETTDGSTEETKWTNHASTITDGLSFGEVETLAPDATATAADEKLLIPTTTDQKETYTVTFNVELLQGIGDNPTSINNYDVTATIKDQAFQPGYAYNITATLKPENVNPSAALEPIVFSVKEIADWTEESADNVNDLNVPEKKAEE